MNWQAPNHTTQFLTETESPFKIEMETNRVFIDADVFFNIVSDLHYSEGFINGMLEGLKLKEQVGDKRSE